MDFDIPDKPEAKPQGSPIADLSYRNYDGVLKNHTLRWRVIALSTMKQLKTNKGFWITSALVSLMYFFQGLQIYFLSNLPVGSTSLMGDDKTKYTQSFLSANTGTSLLLFIIALIVGSGAIAADNKANALLVYLSKPLTKADYLVGKWMGIFLTILLVAIVPSLVLYLFCFTSYLDKGFFKNDPALFVKMIAAACIPAAIHASLIAGASAWSKSLNIARVFYAALYFGSFIVAGMIGDTLYRADREAQQAIMNLSLPGVVNALQQITYHVTVKNFNTTIPIPSPSSIVPLALGLCVVGVAAARAKINAVEVVKG